MKNVIVLGAGYAGIQAALTLHKGLRNEDVNIIIIDRHDRHTLLTELHEVAGNRVEESSVFIPLKEIFQYTKVQMIQEEIVNIDFENKVLRSKEHQFDYDYLIIGCGSEPAYFGIEGMEAHGLTLWSLEDARRIHHHILHMFRQASRERNLEKRQAYLSFVIGGGGFTGIEMVGELIQWVDVLCKEYEIDRREVRLIVVEAMGRILTVLHESLVEKSVDYLKKNDVEIFTNAAITKVTPTHLEIKDGTIIPTNTVIWTGGIKANSFLEKLDLPEVKRGRIEVNEYTQSTKYKEVFLIGDNSYFMTEEGEVLPPLVESAMQTGKSAGKNVIRLIHDKPLERCKPKLHGVMVSIGRKYAVADTMGFRTSGMMAMFIKHMVNIHYQFEVAGFEQVIRYLKHQFIHERKDDHFLKDHLVPRSYTAFLVIMRLYLGYMWLMQGIKKFQEGWLTQTVIYAQRIGPALPDAIANPSPAADTSAEAVQKGLNLIGQHTPYWYAWILENIIVPNALLFQNMIVLTEIALGLAFLTGTFTFIAALISIGMNINFLFSTGLYDYWYIVTSIACMAGAGRSFGVDHYLIPWLMRQWRYIVRNKRLRLNI